MTESELSSDELGEADATSAVDATSHRSLDQGPEVIVLISSLVLHEATFSVAVDRRDVLEVTLTTLVTDRAVQGVVGQQKLHDAAVIKLLVSC